MKLLEKSTQHSAIFSCQGQSLSISKAIKCFSDRRASTRPSEKILCGSLALLISTEFAEKTGGRGQEAYNWQNLK